MAQREEPHFSAVFRDFFLDMQFRFGMGRVRENKENTLAQLRQKSKKAPKSLRFRGRNLGGKNHSSLPG
jgi:hypothetical protein